MLKSLYDNHSDYMVVYRWLYRNQLNELPNKYKVENGRYSLDFYLTPEIAKKILDFIKSRQKNIDIGNAIWQDNRVLRLVYKIFEAFKGLGIEFDTNIPTSSILANGIQPSKYLTNGECNLIIKYFYIMQSSTGDRTPLTIWDRKAVFTANQIGKIIEYRKTCHTKSNCKLDENLTKLYEIAKAQEAKNGK